MKHKILLTLWLALGAMAAQAQRLVVEKATVNCGKTGYMVPTTATFELKNKGSKRIVIESVQPDCGCTKVSLSKNELSGGEKCLLKLSYDARMLGHFEKSAAIVYRSRQGDGTAIPPVYVTMKGVVVPEVRDYTGQYPFTMGDLLVDRNVLEFDDVNQGDQPELVIQVLNNGDHLMTPNVQHLPSYLTAVASPQELLPGKGGKVTVKLNSKNIHDFGLTQSSVHLATQLGEKVTPENEIPVSVVLLPNLKNFEGSNHQYAPQMSLSDSTVVLGTIDGKQRKKAEVIISNKGRIALEISSLQMFTGGLQLTLGKRTLQPGEQTKLKITGNLSQLKKARSKPRILMITNDPDHAKVVIPIKVAGAP